MERIIDEIYTLLEKCNRSCIKFEEPILYNLLILTDIDYNGYISIKNFNVGINVEDIKDIYILKRILQEIEKTE